MINLRKGPVAAAAVGAVALLLSVAVAYGAGDPRYAGRTSQGLRITFRISGKRVRNLNFRIKDRCGGGRSLLVHDFGFSPPMRVNRSRFRGTFHAPHGDKAVVHGRIKGKRAIGYVTDHTLNNKTHKFCNGRATFKLRRK
jgi:hypothetical protein